MVKLWGMWTTGEIVSDILAHILSQDASIEFKNVRDITCQFKKLEIKMTNRLNQNYQSSFMFENQHEIEPFLENCLKAMEKKL